MCNYFEDKLPQCNLPSYQDYIGNRIKTTKITVLKFTKGFSTKINQIINTIIHHPSEGGTPFREVAEDRYKTRERDQDGSSSVTIDYYGKTFKYSE